MFSLQSFAAKNVYPGPQLPSDDHIRVLTLEPGKPGSPIKCQLGATTIDSSPSYEALSYTWGDPEQCTTINVRDSGAETYSDYLVTLNCLAALHRLRYEDRTRTLWIDAICIDQSAISERSHQVSMMSEIYSKAIRVVVHLGEAENDSDLAMEYIQDVDTAESKSSLTYPRSDRLAQAVNILFQRPWFNRVWVVQEIVFASHATVICGSKTLSWASIKIFQQWSTLIAWIHELPFVVSVSISGRIEEDQRFGPVDPLTALEQLNLARHCRATDSRDKIYALLPFLRTNGSNVDLVPDYSKSTSQVFTECAAHLIALSGLDVLSAVQNLPNDPSLPSWVPDWSVPRMRSELLESSWYRAASYSASAGNSEVHKVRVLEDDGSTPAGFHGVMSSSTHVRKPVLQAFGHCDGRITHLASAYVAGQGPFPFAPWRAVYASSLAASREPTRHDWNAYSRIAGNQDFMQMFVDMEEEREHDDNLNDSWCQIVRRLSDARKQDNLPLAYTDIPFELAAYGFTMTAKGIVEETLQRCHNRRLFVTDTGIIGVGPAHLQHGDSLYRCFGEDMTFAFRDNVEAPRGGSAKRVTLIGDCFVRTRAHSDDEKADGERAGEVLECLHII